MSKQKRRHRLPKKSWEEVWGDPALDILARVGWVLASPLIGLAWLYERATGKKTPPASEPMMLRQEAMSQTTTITLGPPLTPEEEEQRRLSEAERRECDWRLEAAMERQKDRSDAAPPFAEEKSGRGLGRCRRRGP